MDLGDVFASVLAAVTNESIQSVLGLIGDHSGVRLDEAFGPFNLFWHPYGHNPSNISSIGLGTKPGRSLTERLTNAIDAILEDRVPSNVGLPRSPELAAKQWFGRPMSGPSDGLFRWRFGDFEHDRRIAVVIHPSGSEAAPTIDTIDSGIGLSAREFPSTILSLHQRNKIQKWYLIGAFGQGGASTLAFCDYALVISRSPREPERVAFTIVRVIKLDETYKEDCYAFLAIRDETGAISVPSIPLTGPLNIHTPVEGVRLPEIRNGTIVRHFAYKLDGLEKKLGPAPGNLYHFLQCSMFDPILPFRLIDLRDPPRDELVTGSRNRLMRLVMQDARDPSAEETGSEIRHYREMEFVVPFGDTDPTIGIEYWVVLNYRKGHGPDRDQLILRSRSNELYVQTGHPIIGSLHGQNQGELGEQILRDVGLGMVARHAIVHIDASRVSSIIRRQLFSTNREGFKEGPILTDLVRVLRKMLQEDEALSSLERELTEKIAKREAQATSDEVKRQVTRLLLDAGFRPKQSGPIAAAGEGKERERVRETKRGRYRQADPLPTLPFPQVTKLTIAWPRPKLEVRLNDDEVVLAETDADVEFDRRGLIAIRYEPDNLELVSKAPLKGGRIRWRVRPNQSSAAGESGQVVVTITRPDGTQLSDRVEYQILPALEEQARESKGDVPDFDIIGINPEDNAQEWQLAWPDLSEDVSASDQASVAYKPINVAGRIIVYYSTIFAPFKEQVQKLTGESAALSPLFRTAYEIWIGYHAILQERGRAESMVDIDPDQIDKVFEMERCRVATMQVKQAARSADIVFRLSRQAAN